MSASVQTRKTRAAIKPYRIGEHVSVRMVEALPYEDRHDWLRLIAASVLTLVTAIMLLIGGVLIFRPGRQP